MSKPLRDPFEQCIDFSVRMLIIDGVGALAATAVGNCLEARSLAGPDVNVSKIVSLLEQLEIRD